MSDKLMNRKLKFEGVILNAVSGYASKVRCEQKGN